MPNDPVDEANDESFPASDPPAWTGTHAGSPDHLMRAMRIHRYGGPEVLELDDAPRPIVREGDVLVRVHAAGVNPLDCKVRKGLYKDERPRPLPAILGWDFSGTVERLGPGVTELAVGDEVFGLPDQLRQGAYAEYLAVRASEVARKPRSLDHVRAAAVPLAALTAWQALFDTAKVAAGQTVLLHAAAGGVGTFAVQLAKWRGAKVIATASAANASFLRELGASLVIDYTKERFEEAARGVDFVLDTIGGDTLKRSYGVLKRGGLLLTLVGRPDESRARTHDIRALHTLVKPSGVELAEIARLVDANVVKPIVSEVLPLAEARRAHELIEAGHVRGKIVLRVAD
jgi:NADPH:quinone reductase-like Zn-dependent oxidoreductase